MPTIESHNPNTISSRAIQKDKKGVRMSLGSGINQPQPGLTNISSRSRLDIQKPKPQKENTGVR